MNRRVSMQMELTGCEIHSREQAAHPGHGSLAHVECVHKLGQEDAEGVGDAVHYQVAHEAGEHDDPAIAAVRGWGQLQLHERAVVILVPILREAHALGTGRFTLRL